MPASLLCWQPDHDVTSPVAESDYLVPIEELLKMSGNQLQPPQSETQVTEEANKPIPPLRTRESFDAVTPLQEQAVRLEEPLPTNSTPTLDDSETGPTPAETAAQASDFSLPVLNGVATRIEDDDIPERSPGFSFTTDDIPPGESSSIEVVYRRSRSESLLDSLLGNVSSAVQHLLSGPSTDTVDEQSEDDDSRPVVSFTESLPARKEDSIKRRFTDGDIVDEVKHSDMPDETRLRSSTVSR